MEVWAKPSYAHSTSQNWKFSSVDAHLKISDLIDFTRKAIYSLLEIFSQPKGLILKHCHTIIFEKSNLFITNVIQ